MYICVCTGNSWGVQPYVNTGKYRFSEVTSETEPFGGLVSWTEFVELDYAIQGYRLPYRQSGLSNLYDVERLA